MATYTSYLNLEKPATSETFNLSKINSNWDKIDTGCSNLNSALGGLTFKKFFMNANATKTVTVGSSSSRLYLFFSSSYISHVGVGNLGYYGTTTRCDGITWIKEATGITVDTSTDGQFTISTTQNATVLIAVLAGSVTV